jgi:UPF0716 protein FxsA
MRFLFVIFVVVPLIEIVLLINVGQLIGAWPTIGLVLLSAFIGVNMLRHQGLSTLFRARSRMDAGELPAQEMIEGIILAVGGALLVTPGFVTDFFGFCCLIPFTRKAVVSQLKQHFSVVVSQQGEGSVGHGQAHRPGGFEPGSRSANGSGQTIDGEYRRDE